MLILNRKVGESLVIGDDIELKVLEIYEGKVKVGIKAPKAISVLRKEIYEAVKMENQESLNATKNPLDVFVKNK